MYNPNKFLIAIFFTWILCGTQVQCYFKDSFCPVNFDSSEWFPYQRNPRVAQHTNGNLNCEKPDIYVCEEPPNPILTDAGKACNYRNVWYHEQVFRWVAGRGCLFYTPDFLFVGGRNPINLNAACVYRNMLAPCLEIVKEDGTCGCYPFDPSFEEVAVTVRNALIPSAQRRWEHCYYKASDCCSHVMDGNMDANGRCVPTFDGWSCWDAAENGTTVENVCPDLAYSNSGPSCHHYSTKECYSNGTWEQRTEYGSCSVTPRLVTRYAYHISMLAFSTLSCIPAICIFFFYKRLRVIRVALHRNLLIAIAVRNILVIISRAEIYIDELTSIDDTAMSVHSIACRALAVAERVAGNAVFVCMLVEGIYLHRLIVAVFKNKLNISLLYGIGAVITIIPVVAWAIVMGLHNDHSCWVVYTVDHIQWILDGPRIIILVLNTILFIDVLRVLLTKLRNSENSNQLSTAKATLFLMPLFGTQFIFTAIRPNTTNCLFEQVYYFVAYTIEGLQGLFVSLLYCYVNKEVHALIRATYRKTESVLVSHMRGSNYPRTSIDPKSDRRHTCSTGINSQNTDYAKNRYSTTTPKLHVAEIISIQASERLAEILEPVYETIDNRIVNEGYDYLERSDNDSGYMPRTSKVEEYYGFTNASSVSIGCPDWLKCASPPESIYNNSIAIFDEPNKDKNEIKLDNYEDALVDQKQKENIPLRKVNNNKSSNISNECNYDNNNANESTKDDCFEPEQVTDIEMKNFDDKTMLDEIMQYMVTKGNEEVKLKPELLSPNRPNGEKIVFINEET